MLSCTHCPRRALRLCIRLRWRPPPLTCPRFHARLRIISRMRRERRLVVPAGLPPPSSLDRFRLVSSRRLHLFRRFARVFSSQVCRHRSRLVQHCRLHSRCAVGPLLQQGVGGGGIVELARREAVDAIVARNADSFDLRQNSLVHLHGVDRVHRLRVERQRRLQRLGRPSDEPLVGVHVLDGEALRRVRRQQASDQLARL
mmetsp:Transcript_7575/g.24904  ORF Transcript_7575/g.24904 Transcript_7575/m.24904 type:complete len:200 (+) Transcript_7575:347-946(+)